LRVVGDTEAYCQRTTLAAAVDRGRGQHIGPIGVLSSIPAVRHAVAIAHEKVRLVPIGFGRRLRPVELEDNACDLSSGDDRLDRGLACDRLALLYAAEAGHARAPAAVGCAACEECVANGISKAASSPTVSRAMKGRMMRLVDIT